MDTIRSDVVTFAAMKPDEHWVPEDSQDFWRATAANKKFLLRRRSELSREEFTFFDERRGSRFSWSSDGLEVDGGGRSFCGRPRPEKNNPRHHRGCDSGGCWGQLVRACPTAV